MRTISLYATSRTAFLLIPSVFNKKSNMSQKSPKPQKVKPSSNPPFVVEIPSQVKMWYMKISHPYIMPLPLGDLPRPHEQDALIEDEAKAKGGRATNLVSPVS
jgi:hypothetical protein